MIFMRFELRRIDYNSNAVLITILAATSFLSAKTVNFALNNLTMRPSAPIILLVCMLALAACNPQQPLTPDDQKFMDVYADILLAQGSYEMLVDSLKRRYNKSDTLSLIFASHRYAPEAFARQMESYRRRPKHWQDIQARTIQLLEERKQRAIDERQRLQLLPIHSKAPLQ
ncbi:MAG: hypothetical protein HY22_05375 [[Candidatus Thermochlorobacteriaceae] bacterium GBChlB]|nr:MAG: hypothetical protein HY22_05375 [[Candidatus Thermochlorobacteriaceae] bacterium GBChlB]